MTSIKQAIEGHKNNADAKASTCLDLLADAQTALTNASSESDLSALLGYLTSVEGYASACASAASQASTAASSASDGSNYTLQTAIEDLSDTVDLVVLQWVLAVGAHAAG